MDTLRFCPQCQQPLPANAPEGLCPQCLIRAATSPPSEPQPVTTSGGDIPDIGDPVAVGKCLPQFEIIELLGRGGMGVVYKARQLNLDRIVALKILPPVDSQSADFVERFRREARSLAKLSHPNIVAVHDFGESGGLYYFAMEFVDGANLREMIRTGKMKPEEALAVVPKICDALQFAHEEGVVHRDVKPENILIDKRGRVKIADFGLAKLLRREQADQTLTMTGMTLGTPRYMAPEQLDKPETVDHRADIYSLGVVFYEMLTGEVPMGRFAPPSEKVRIDVRLDEIVLHALERDADRRYQHVSQVRDDVEKVTSKPRVAPASVPVKERTMPPPVEREAATPGPSLRALIISGIATILSAILIALLVTGAFVDRSSFDAFFRQDSVTIALLVMQTLALTCGVLMVIAGLNAAASPSFARTAAKLACVPLTPAWLITLPVGIYVLNKLPKIATEPATASDESRLSRCALIGAIWAALGVVAAIVWVLWNHFYTAPPTPASDVLVAQVREIVYYTPKWPVFLLALTAPFGATILGAIAIAQIKRSGGKLYGLRLAAADAIFFPLLVVGAVAFYITNRIASTIAFNLRTPVTLSPDAPPERGLAVIDFAVLDALVALTVCFFVGRAAWRAISGYKKPEAVPSVKAPAMWMLVSGIAGSVNAFAFTMMLISEGQWEKRLAGCIVGVIVCVAFAVLAAFVFRGALKTLNREDYAASRLAALCSIFSFNILSLPIGIWALVRLSKPEVKALFAEKPTEPKTSSHANESNPGSENIAGKRPGFLRHVIMPTLIVAVACILISLLCIATLEKKGAPVLRLCWQVSGTLVPLVLAILAAQWAWGRGGARRVLGFFSLRSWVWPLAALVLVPVATRIPRPADLPVPAMSELFTPMVLVTPEGGSYRFVAFDGWEKFKPVYSVSWGVTSAQEVTRTGRELPLGANLGFFHRSATWKYSLFASRFDWKSPADGVLDIAPGEIAKLRPLVVEELNKRAFGRGRALEDFLDNGRHEETSVCWQNVVVLLAWLSLPLAAVALLLRLWPALFRKK